MGSGQYSGTTKMARRLKNRINELTRQIAEIDNSAGPEPADKESDEWFRWEERRLNALEDSNRGELVTERKRLRQQLEEINGGGQLSLFRDSQLPGESEPQEEQVEKPKRGTSNTSYTQSEFADKGKVELVRNDNIGNAGDYQGANSGSGKAYHEYTINNEKMRRALERIRKDAPKTYDSEIANIVMGISGPETMVTVYRATSGDSINHGDWVFLTEKQADNWARSTFTKKPKQGWRVVSARVPARMIGYSGKNLEFLVV